MDTMESSLTPPLPQESLPEVEALNQKELAYIENLESENKPKKRKPAEITVREGNLIKEAMGKMPEAVLPHVVSAAEKDQPLEAVYERRHETKDDPTAPVAIGSVIASIPRKQTLPLPPSVPPPFSPVSEPAPTKRISRVPELTYRQGARLGFIIGAGLIVTTVIIFSLIHFL